MYKKTLRAIALLAAVSLPGIAAAASTAIATTNVNLRAGPSTAYPAVNVVGAGEDVRVFGCLSNRSWCDVAYAGQRGWMSSNYLAYVERGRRYTGPRVVSYIGAPTVAFSVGSYWDNHYRGRSFYRDRARWERHGGWDRHDRDRWEDRRDDRRGRDRDRDRWEDRRDNDEVRGRDRDRDRRDWRPREEARRDSPRNDSRRDAPRNDGGETIYMQQEDPFRN
jgi:uncharacterized protein YraI